MSYDPTHPGESITIEWLTSELQRIAGDMDKPKFLEFEVLTAEPARPQEGAVAFADGTSWNPGAGRGLYEYNTGAWVKL